MKKINFLIWFVGLSLFLPAGIYSQVLKGIVVDEKGEPVFSAAVILQKPDSSFLQATTTDMQGNFQLPRPQGAYGLCIQHLAYETKFVSGEEADLGKIVLVEKSNRLAEVTVKASAPQVKVTEHGALAYNTQLLAQNRPVRNALDLLSEVPSIEKTGDSYRIVGSNSTTILLNGRKTNMTTEQITRMLASMPPARVENIEVFYNTPPAYGVRGGSVNIVLKKSRSEKLEVKGDVYTNLSQGYYYSMDGGLNLGIAKDKWSWNAGYSLGSEKKRRADDFLSYHTLEGQLYFVDTENRAKTTDFDHTFVSDFSLDLGEHGSLNLFYNGNVSDSKFKEHSDLQKEMRSFVDRNTIDGDKQLHTLALELKWKSLKIGGDYLFYDQKNNQSLSSSADTVQQVLESQSKQRANKWNVFVQNSHPIGKAVLSYGLEWGMSDTENSYLTGKDEISLSDHSFFSKQKETSASVFASWSQRFGKRISLNAALEAEYFKSDYEKDGKVKQTLWKDLYLYPSLTFLYRMKRNNMLQATFNSRKMYPSYWQTSPSISYLNSYWMTQGNTKLKPYTAYQFNVNYILKGRYVIGAGAMISPDYFTQLMFQDRKELKVVSQYINFDYNRQYVLMGVIPVRWAAWFDSRLVATGFYQSQKGVLAGMAFQREKLAGRISMTHNFTLDRAKCWSFQLTGFYQLPSIQGIYDVDDLYEVSAALSWKQKNGPWKLTLTGVDVFDIYRQKTKVDYGGQRYDLQMDMNRQCVTLTVQYSFNGYKEKEHKQIDSSRFGL